jgi:autotransporter-associated beta strand protein
VPSGTNVTALAPQITVSEGASVDPPSGVARDFTKPQTYTVTGRNGARKVFTVTVNSTPLSSRKDIVTFALPNSTTTIRSGTAVTVCVPDTTSVQSLTPTFTLSPFATAAPPSGTSLNLSNSQKITVTAQDGSAQVYTIAAAKAKDVSTLTWNSSVSGKWSDASKWQSLANTAPDPAGRADYILNFNAAGKYDVTNDLRQGFQLNQLNLGTGQGQNIKIDGNSLAFTPNPAAGIAPAIQVTSVGQRAVITTPIDLTGDVAVNMSLVSEVTLEGLISGDGRLVLNSTDPNPQNDNYHYMACRLRVDGKGNTYRGGTVIRSGRFMLFSNDRGLGTGPVTLHENGRIWIVIAQKITNPLISFGGMVEGDSSWNAPVTLNGNLRVTGRMTFHETGGGLTGPGGLTMVGAGGPWGWVNAGETKLYGANTYAGPTTVVRGTLSLKRAAALYGGDMSKWTAANISVRAPATLRISVGGRDEFTGEQVGTLLKNLTTGINSNGLMGGSFFCIDTANATGAITISTVIADSRGPGGGWFFFKKAGVGTLELTGDNTYTGQTFLEGGTLIVSSLNSVSGGRPASCLGAPTTPEAGAIELASDCGLTYTGKGEVTDRILDLTGNHPQTVTLDQSGSGQLKFTSDFVFTGFGHNKTIILNGSTAGTGEIAGNIADPYDRAGKSTTALTKSGAGTWILSGANTYTGPTRVTQCTLSLANARSLGDKTDVSISEGAMLDLNFKGEMRIRKLILDGRPQPAGSYSAANTPRFIKGTGVLRNEDWLAPLGGIGSRNRKVEELQVTQGK